MACVWASLGFKEIPLSMNLEKSIGILEIQRSKALLPEGVKGKSGLVSVLFA